MNKLILAAVAATSIFAANAAENNDNAANDWRISVGGTARGSMKAYVDGFSSARFETYGVDLDLQYRALSAGDFNLWAGIGGTYTPKQHIGSVSYAEIDNSGAPYATTENYGVGKMDVAVGEFRLMLVPEYALTERWTVGARIGAAFDWIQASYKYTMWGRTSLPAYGEPIPYGPYSEKGHMTEFLAQAILGLQTTYMFTDNLGLYANIDYRCGGDVSFKEDGEEFAKLKMNGWVAGVGALLSF